MAKKIVWQEPSGHVRITHPDLSKKKPSETEEDFLNRIAETLKQKAPEFQSFTFTFLDENNLPNDRSRRNAWRLNPQGKVIPDPNIELPEEAKSRIKNSAKNKLKSGQPLTDEEADELIK